MKKVIDIFQVLLSDDSGIGFAAWCIVSFMVFQVVRIALASAYGAKALIGYAYKLLYLPTSKGRALVLLSCGLVLFIFRAPLVQQIQYIEQAYISPTYVVSDTSYWATSCYETELKKSVNQSEFETVRDSTYALAKELGCEPLAIYEVAFSECGMNPFCVRTDGIAAGWIQFTNDGVRGLGVTLGDVKEWCRDRDAKNIMMLTGRYMRRAAAGRNLQTSTAIYCAVFAPAKIDHNNNQALYSGWDRPEYYLNKGLDGFVIRGEKVLFLESTRDGVLTKNDLTAALAYKKARLLKKY